MNLDVIAYVGSIAYESAAFEALDFKGQPILYNKPDVAAWKGCLQRFVGEARNG